MIDFSPGSKLSTLFHQAWGQAKASPEYDKSVWTELDLALSRCRIPDPLPQPLAMVFEQLNRD